MMYGNRFSMEIIRRTSSCTASREVGFERSWRQCSVPPTSRHSTPRDADSSTTLALSLPLPSESPTWLLSWLPSPPATGLRRSPLLNPSVRRLAPFHGQEAPTWTQHRTSYRTSNNERGVFDSRQIVTARIKQLELLLPATAYFDSVGLKPGFHYPSWRP